MTSYLTSIDTFSLYNTVFEIFDFKVFRVSSKISIWIQKASFHQNQLYSGCCRTYFLQLTRGRFRFLPFLTLVPHLTLWTIRSCWTGCRFRTEYRDLRSIGCNPSSSVVHRRFIMVVRSRGVLSCDLELLRDKYWARSCTSSTQPTSRNLWNRSVLESISMLTTPSFTIHASRQTLLN